MKTYQQNEEYTLLIEKQKNAVEDVKRERNEIEQSINKSNGIYIQALKEDDGEKAEQEFENKESLKQSLKKIDNKLKIKQDMYNISVSDKKINLLIEVNDLKAFYSDDIRFLQQEMKKVEEQYSKLVKQIEELNKEYIREEMHYKALYESLTQEQKGELRKKYNISNFNWNKGALIRAESKFGGITYVQ